eukprot:TRINITY_DN13810_c0_g1_i1.p1 TRINITY_DN13810_c0_g1~~TRINITY_DN13810_c0_g1_i1.p1  ORF type:complete len:209 (-),score=37.03 TRINITY_DN13810_c0_g1_i1:177-803(-)
MSDRALGGEEVDDERGHLLPVPAHIGRPTSFVADSEDLEQPKSYLPDGGTSGHVSTLPLTLPFRLITAWLGSVCRWVTNNAPGRTTFTEASAESALRIKRRNHMTDMEAIAAAVAGDAAVDEARIMTAMRRFPDDDGKSLGLTLPQLRALFYFSDATKLGNEFIRFLENAGKYDGGSDAIAFDILLQGFIDWRHQRACLLNAVTPQRM